MKEQFLNFPWIKIKGKSTGVSGKNHAKSRSNCGYDAQLYTQRKLSMLLRNNESRDATQSITWLLAQVCFPVFKLENSFV